MPKKPVTYTPGPLGIQPMPGQSYRILGGPRNSRLADVYATAAHNGEANARLFAAAPILLDAALAAYDFLASSQDALERAMHALGVQAPMHAVPIISRLADAISQATLSSEDRNRIKDEVLGALSGAEPQYICDECGGTRVLAAAVPCHVCSGTGRTHTGPASHRLPPDQVDQSHDAQGDTQ